MFVSVYLSIKLLFALVNCICSSCNYGVILLYAYYLQLGPMRELDVIDVARQVSVSVTVMPIMLILSVATGGHQDEDERVDRVLRGS